MKNILAFTTLVLLTSVSFAGNGGGTMNSVAEQRAVLFLSSTENEVEFDVATLDLGGERIHRVVTTIENLQGTKTLESLKESFQSKTWEVIK